MACYYMAKALADMSFDVDFVVPYSADHSDITWMRVHNGVKTSPGKRSNGQLAYSNSIDELRVVQDKYIDYVEEMVKQSPPDVIHAHDWLTVEAGIRAKQITNAPLVVHVHATEFDRSGTNDGNPLIHDIEYQGLMMADRIIAVSNITKGIIVHKYGIPPEKIDVIHNAIDLEQFNKVDYSYDGKTYKYIEEMKREGYTIVSTITRLTVQKGLTHLLKGASRACERYEKFIFLFVGDGEQRDELLELSAKYGIAEKVVFTGFVRGKKWRDAYNVSDVFVMSSISEPFGLTALEAAHHDNALIITKQSGVSEVLNSVYKYDFWDTDKLADQLIAIATLPVLKNALKRDVAKEYNRTSWSDVAEKCANSYRLSNRKVALV